MDRSIWMHKRRRFRNSKFCRRQRRNDRHRCCSRRRNRLPSQRRLRRGCVGCARARGPSGGSRRRAGGGIAAALGLASDGGPEDINPLYGTTYTQKVMDQMAQDDYHGFPSLIDTLPRSTDVCPRVGNDGTVRSLVELPGSINGVSGNYQWIIEPVQTINHRFFQPS